jgi:ADP-ribosylglycohydrolase
MTFAVADWLLSDKEHTPQKLINNLVWFANEFPCPMGGYGGRFSEWLQKPKTVYEDVMMEDGSTKRFMREVREPYNSWGNGAAMRTSAVGWMFDTLEETERVAEIQAAVTHNHPEGIKGAQAAAAAIYMARNGSSKEEIKAYIERTFGYDLNFTIDEIREDYDFDESCQGSLPPALVAFFESTDFEDAIRRVISVGGDSDTLGAICGGIAEAYYGIPEWMEKKAFEVLSFRENRNGRFENQVLASQVKRFREEVQGK